MSGHTKGPWRVETAGHLQPTSRLVVGADGVSIAIFSSAGNAKKSEAQLEADVALVVAAPELLAAMDAAEQCIGELPPTQARVEAMQMIQAAIAKAQGEA